MSSLTAAFHVIQLGQLYRHTVRHLLAPVVEDQEPGLGDRNPFCSVEIGVAGESGIQICDVEEKPQGHVGVEGGLVFIQIHSRKAQEISRFSRADRPVSGNTHHNLLKSRC